MKRTLGILAVVLLASGIAEAGPVHLIQSKESATDRGSNMTIKLRGDRGAGAVVRETANRIADFAMKLGADSARVSGPNFITGTTTIRVKQLPSFREVGKFCDYTVKAVARQKSAAPEIYEPGPLHLPLMTPAVPMPKVLPPRK